MSNSDSSALSTNQQAIPLDSINIYPRHAHSMFHAALFVHRLRVSALLLRTSVPAAVDRPDRPEHDALTHRRPAWRHLRAAFATPGSFLSLSRWRQFCLRQLAYGRGSLAARTLDGLRPFRKVPLPPSRRRS
uniref:Uncharacterized protein n=1 Tax=Steinernema glaseri TaxID=37863 RepID=A0A1I7YP14_9BILA